jgi:hypothetical protein
MWLLKGTLQLTFELFLLVSSTSYICSPHIVSVFSEADWITHTSYRLLQSRFQPSRELRVRSSRMAAVGTSVVSVTAALVDEVQHTFADLQATQKVLDRT